LCALAAVAAAAAIAPVSVSWDVGVALLVLCAFAIAATNLEVLPLSNFAMSGNVMILTASLVIFHDLDCFLGPVIVGLCCALFDVVHLRAREWQKIGFNAGADTIALLAAGTLFWAIADQFGSGSLSLIIATSAAALAYLIANSTLVSLPVSLSSGEPYRTALRKIMAFDLSAYPFAVLGLGLGWVYLNLGIAVLPLLVVPILIARRTFASYLELRTAQEQTIETLILALEAKDRYTAGHAQRVAMFCEYVGVELGFSPGRMDRLRYAALMHDIGKLIVPNQLLNKPGRLTASEYERVRRHEGVSVELLRRIDFLAPVAGDTTTEAATAAVDGEGLVEPAIIHVADAFDAMTSTRSYRKALTQETAFLELRQGAGTQFNAECVEALIRAIEQRGEHYGAGYEVEPHEWDVAPPEAGTGSAGLGDVLPDRDEQPRERAAKR
jgi:hypothetical protein